MFECCMPDTCNYTTRHITIHPSVRLSIHECIHRDRQTASQPAQPARQASRQPARQTCVHACITQGVCIYTYTLTSLNMTPISLQSRGPREVLPFGPSRLWASAWLECLVEAAAEAEMFSDAGDEESQLVGGRWKSMHVPN